MAAPQVYVIVLLGVLVVAAGTFVLAPSQAAVAIPLYTLVAVGILNLLQGAAAAAKVAEVAEKTDGQDARLEQIAETAEATHTLVNSARDALLRTNWLLARRIAEMTESPADQHAAEEARRLWEEHQSRQTIVDAAPPTRRRGS